MAAIEQETGGPQKSWSGYRSKTKNLCQHPVVTRADTEKLVRLSSLSMRNKFEKYSVQGQMFQIKN
jgi:hypothetical protein